MIFFCIIIIIINNKLSIVVGEIRGRERQFSFQSLPVYITSQQQQKDFLFGVLLTVFGFFFSLVSYLFYLLKKFKK